MPRTAQLEEKKKVEFSKFGFIDYPVLPLGVLGQKVIAKIRASKVRLVIVGFDPLHGSLRKKGTKQVSRCSLAQNRTDCIPWKQ